MNSSNLSKTVFWSFSVAFIWVMASSQASASLTGLTNHDWQTSGDNLITYDSSTGLEWLSPRFTRGLSIADGEAKPFFDASAAAGKFRWASGAEIIQVMSEIPFASNLNSLGAIDDYSAQGVADANQFISLFGATSNGPSSSDWIPGLNKLQAISQGSPGPSGFGLSEVLTVQYGPDTGRATVVSPLSSNCCYSETFSRNYIGLWLVRPYSPAPVPLPAPVALLAPALLGLVRVRRSTT